MPSLARWTAKRMKPSTASRADRKVVTRANIDVMTIAVVADRLQATDTNGSILHSRAPSLIVAAMRRAFIWISLVLSGVVLVGIALQLYFIAAWVFGSADALDAHKTVGGAVVHPAEVLVFLVALVGWWRNWRNIAWSFALALIGTIQIFTVGDLGNPGDAWVHGLHGGLVIFVVAFAAHIARREARALDLFRP